MKIINLKPEKYFLFEELFIRSGLKSVKISICLNQ